MTAAIATAAAAITGPVTDPTDKPCCWISTTIYFRAHVTCPLGLTKKASVSCPHARREFRPHDLVKEDLRVKVCHLPVAK